MFTVEPIYMSLARKQATGYSNIRGPDGEWVCRCTDKYATFMANMLNAAAMQQVHTDAIVDNAGRVFEDWIARTPGVKRDV